MKVQKEERAELKQSKIFESIVESVEGMNIHAVDRQYRYLYFNRSHHASMVESYGTVVETGMCILDCISETEDRDTLKRHYDQVLTGESLTVIEEYGGAVRSFFEVLLNPIVDAEDEIVGVSAFSRDVSERQKTREALLLTQTSVDFARDAVYWMGPDAQFIYVNNAAVEALGYTREELLTMTSHDISPELSLEDWSAHWSELRDKKSFVIRTDHRRKDGSTFPVEITVNLIEFADREINCAIAKDITERQRANAELREADLRHRTLLEGSPVCTKVVDVNSRLVYMSRAGIEQLKISDVESYYGSVFPLDFYPPTSAGQITERLDRAIAGEITNVECPVNDMEGGELWFDTTFVPALDDDGSVRYVIVTSVNITSRKLAEQEKLALERQLFRQKLKSQ